MVKLYKIGLILFLVSLLAMSVGCETKQGQGYDEREDVRIEYGEPEDVYTYISDDYWSESWWYWSQGIEFDFVKRERAEHETIACVKGDKTVYTDIVVESIYEFTPITSKQEQMKIRQEFEQRKKR